MDIHWSKMKIGAWAPRMDKRPSSPLGGDPKEGIKRPTPEGTQKPGQERKG